MDPTQPFALLWDRDRQQALLFDRPDAVIDGSDIDVSLDEASAVLRTGHWLAGGVSYEAGTQLLPHLTLRPGRVLFLRQAQPARMNRQELEMLVDRWRKPVALGAPEPRVPRDRWIKAVERAQQYIAAGDIYQANLSFQATLPFQGHPLHLFARLFDPDAARHGGLVHDGCGKWWLCLSPELFFRLEGRHLTVRPMKGTAPRLADPAADEAVRQALHQDEKNRAENLMITDLLRNDLSMVAEPGSVRVEKLFAVETYPGVHQLTSTVTAELSPGLGPVDALKAFFPCGSITGAPKLRAMQLIDELEDEPRGIYCGAIGWMGPDDAHFAVAIRTVAISDGQASIGLGAGVVADSRPDEEWEECQWKASFLDRRRPDTLIETMCAEADGTIPRLHLHLDRLRRSASHFGFPFDAKAAVTHVQLPPGSPRRVRLLLSAKGHLAVQVSPAPAPRIEPLAVRFAALPLPAKDWRLAHKTGDRQALDAARRAHSAQEVIFLDPEGRATEGSWTSLFIALDDGTFLTPPLSLGLLPSVLRRELSESGKLRESILLKRDIQNASRENRLYMGNALRGLMPAILLE